MAVNISTVRSIRSESTVTDEDLPWLEQAKAFLLNHDDAHAPTHIVFGDYPDWWVPPGNFQGKLAMAEDNTLEQLYRYMADLYEKNMPLTICEVLTDDIRLVQDIHILNSSNEPVSTETLFDPQGALLRKLGEIILQLFRDPPQGFWNAVALDASGIVRIKGVWKSSLRLVWPRITVEKDTAMMVREYIIHSFEESPDQNIADLKDKLLAMNRENTWKNIFSEAIFTNREGSIRMPLNDRVAERPMNHVRELRPFRPHGLLKFQRNQEEGDLHPVEMMAEPSDLDLDEWLKLGCVRSAEGRARTPFTAPTQFRRPARAPGKGAGRGPGGGGGSGGGKGGGSGGNAPGWNGAQITLGARGGSDNYQVRPGRGGGGKGGGRAYQQQPQQDTQKTIEREFVGTAQEFREAIATVIPDGQFTEENGHITFTAGGDYRITFQAANSRHVQISGSEQQLRTIAGALAGFLQQVGGGGTERTARSITGSHTRSRAGSPGAASKVAGSVGRGGYAAPSQVFAPAAPASRIAPGQQVYVAIENFKGESDTELSFEIGMQLTVKEHPSDSGGWAFGQLISGGAEGWFPFNHVRLAK
mmetsp:Transcript_57087/g.121306  ORF Transcript_57087/g.121306 Transcript_57087/m.121306 type:complete len:586 (+) Transcript_57087:76-1833(+)|eukprot:CAMPEP_0206475458 /NCGR_PEP_ID=MMETSP0324_2-20121206/34092_1 /ASSEMBLY_ACC=CAM_ASM_000836 /TAXON_ID=2866 /ORGANISM="Crypthecodinium cohnii, Strain Seligo" /LENGTH=585 /DNA_ID=CAMNT_0053950821 /DNA_START=128 /DNA_END=1885 /DNA_ORIENTATION=+